MHYDYAQICLNGHLINPQIETSPEYNKNYCTECGSKTITKCEKCGCRIKGDYIGDNFMEYNENMYGVPNFCQDCGEPFPWTKSRVEAAIELSNESDELSIDEKEIFKNNIQNILTDNPKTEVSATRIKKILKKVGKNTYDALYKLFVEIASETAKKTLLGE